MRERKYYSFIRKTSNPDLSRHSGQGVKMEYNGEQLVLGLTIGLVISN